MTTTDRQTDSTVTFHLREVVPFHIFYGIPRRDNSKLFRLEAWNIKQSQQRDSNSIRHAAEPTDRADRTSNIRIRYTAGHPGDLENQSLKEADQETDAKTFGGRRTTNSIQISNSFTKAKMQQHQMRRRQMRGRKAKAYHWYSKETALETFSCKNKKRKSTRLSKQGLIYKTSFFIFTSIFAILLAFQQAYTEFAEQLDASETPRPFY